VVRVRNNTYECYYLDKGSIQSRAYVVAEDDARALVRALEMLTDSHFICMEVRQSARLVGRITLGSPAALMASEGLCHTPEPR
jgi:hypothetical protein